MGMVKEADNSSLIPNPSVPPSPSELPPGDRPPLLPLSAELILDKEIDEKERRARETEDRDRKSRELKAGLHPLQASSCHLAQLSCTQKELKTSGLVCEVQKETGQGEPRTKLGIMTSDGIDPSTPVPPLSNGSPHTKSPFFPEFLHRWDSQHSLRIHKIGLRIPRFFLQALEYSGDGLFWIPITTALCWAPYFILQPFFKSLFIGFMFDLIVIGTIKALVRRPRPVYNKGMYVVISVDHHSFPSGHSSRAFLIFIFVLKHASEWKATILQAPRVLINVSNEVGNALEILGDYLIPFIFACWATATASSRILLGRHFLLDVVVGSFLGVLEALFVIWTLLPIQFFLDDQQRWILECGHNIKEVVLKLV